MTTTEVSDSLERVDGIINMLDEICDHMDGFSSAEEAWLSSITETLRTWGYVMQETYEGPEESKDDWQLRETLGRTLGWRFCLGNPDDKIPAWPLVHCGFIWTS